MQVYKILKRAIEKQMYSKEKLQQMLTIYYLVGQITEEEYIELSGLLAQVEFKGWLVYSHPSAIQIYI